MNTASSNAHAAHAPLTPAPAWYEQGLPHIWLPYSQMQTAPPPLPCVATQGSRITLADGRTLVDGVAAWWTACHGYNHPHIHAAAAEQLARMPHVMFGGMVHEPALRLASRLCACCRVTSNGFSLPIPAR